MLDDDQIRLSQLNGDGFIWFPAKFICHLNPIWSVVEAFGMPGILSVTDCSSWATHAAARRKLLQGKEPCSRWRMNLTPAQKKCARSAAFHCCFVCTLHSPLLPKAAQLLQKECLQYNNQHFFISCQQRLSYEVHLSPSSCPSTVLTRVWPSLFKQSPKNHWIMTDWLTDCWVCCRLSSSLHFAR